MNKEMYKLKIDNEKKSKKVLKFNSLSHLKNVKNNEYHSKISKLLSNQIDEELVDEIVKSCNYKNSLKSRTIKDSINNTPLDTKQDNYKNKFTLTTFENDERFNKEMNETLSIISFLKDNLGNNIKKQKKLKTLFN